ncbi:hypothetical protein RFI_22050 [Reticulomyxa filosa]|uniref:Uncharacterized protein n=1 Tax=Reticulomyxa filosa TaxID=46433 RepID=X6MN77_RETFI|nr:hypothetical protein RFI_36021 [Reticulomyxa filosa]ETO15314.1 hypothetical protein RFI_22050 [Reticulomyxa filosa]|eukprot:ETO01420.1 hypothetical protein RFI_36021 [Reticulomyxa filosa]
MDTPADPLTHVDIIQAILRCWFSTDLKNVKDFATFPYTLTKLISDYSVAKDGSLIVRAGERKELLLSSTKNYFEFEEIILESKGTLTVLYAPNGKTKGRESSKSKTKPSSSSSSSSSSKKESNTEKESVLYENLPVLSVIIKCFGNVKFCKNSDMDVGGTKHRIDSCNVYLQCWKDIIWNENSGIIACGRAPTDQQRRDHIRGGHGGNVYLNCRRYYAYV